ncbi:hypothetical protein HK096_008548, partial [Nowakowskiella sp. JEL0078]
EKVLVGTSVQKCLEALSTPDPTSSETNLHLIDRVNLDFKLESCILANSAEYPKIKVSGKLPLLNLRLSDRKYKSVMATIELVLASFRPDINALPNSKTEEATDEAQEWSQSHHKSINFDDFDDTESNFYDAISEGFENEQVDWADEQNARERLTTDQLLKRIITSLNFEIGEVAVSLLKASPNSNTEKTLASLSVRAFRLVFTQRTFDIGVKIDIADIKIRDLLRSDERYAYLLEAVPAAPRDAVCKIEYLNRDKRSPEFNDFRQMLDINTQMVDIVLCRSSILALYDYILSTFTTPAPTTTTTFVATTKIEETSLRPNDEPLSLIINSTTDRIRFVIDDDGTRLGTLEFNAAKGSLTMQSNTLKIEGKLGDLSLVDDTRSSPAFTSLLHIEGSQVADFVFETFDPNGDYKGYDSQFTLRAASVRIAYVEATISRLQAFFSEFTEMHLLLDSARRAAVESAAMVQQTAGKFRFDVVIQTPIVDIPRPGDSDFVTMYLGELTAGNEIAVDGQCGDVKVVRVNEIRAELRAVRIETCLKTRVGARVRQCIPEI